MVAKLFIEDRADFADLLKMSRSRFLGPLSSAYAKLFQDMDAAAAARGDSSMIGRLSCDLKSQDEDESLSSFARMLVRAAIFGENNNIRFMAGNVLASFVNALPEKKTALESGVDWGLRDYQADRLEKGVNIVSADDSAFRLISHLADMCGDKTPVCPARIVYMGLAFLRGRGGEGKDALSRLLIVEASGKPVFKAFAKTLVARPDSVPEAMGALRSSSSLFRRESVSSMVHNRLVRQVLALGYRR